MDQQPITKWTLENENAQLRDALTELLFSTRFHIDKYHRGWWVCSVCRESHNSLNDLEQGVGHSSDCAYAKARKLLLHTDNAR